MAWWYMQEGFQTGAYDAQFVHNGLLQVALDVGIIPALLIISTFIIGFFDKKGEARDKVLMLIILGHSLIDFNMEFLAITLVLFMTLRFDKQIQIKESLKLRSSIIIVGIIYLFFASITTLNACGNYNLANSIFPYSIALNNELSTAKDFTQQVKISEKLYAKNKYFLNASIVLSKKEQALGNYKKAHNYEEWVMKNKKYTMLNYIEYVQFLESAINYCYVNNDLEGMNTYINKLLNVPNIIQDVKDTSDSLAFKIAHKPRLDMPKEMIEYIEEMKQYSQK